MKKTLFLVLVAFVVLGCPTATPKETRTFYRAIKIGEIEEPICKYPNANNEEGAYVPVTGGYYNVHQEDDRQKWVLHFGDNYGADIYIGQAQPADCDNLDEIPENPFDLKWVNKWFMTDGSGGHEWPYEKSLIMDSSIWTWAVQMNYVAFQANIYQWTQITE
jgi:hypothetical protein